jgi:hypothetical protein
MSLHERQFAIRLHLVIIGLFIFAFIISALTGSPIEGPSV